MNDRNTVACGVCGATEPGSDGRCKACKREYARRRALTPEGKETIRLSRLTPEARAEARAAKRDPGEPERAQRFVRAKVATVEYATWLRMRVRCNSDADAKHYRDKGVSVCERWDSFENFIADMGPRPADKSSIDRIDNSKGYAPDNCRWANDTEQNRNKCTTMLVTVDGETLPLGVWADRSGVGRAAAYARVATGWSALDAVITPKGGRNPHPADPALRPRSYVPVGEVRVTKNGGGTFVTRMKVAQPNVWRRVSAIERVRHRES